MQNRKILSHFVKIISKKCFQKKKFLLNSDNAMNYPGIKFPTISSFECFHTNTYFTQKTWFVMGKKIQTPVS